MATSLLHGPQQKLQKLQVIMAWLLFHSVLSKPALHLHQCRQTHAHVPPTASGNLIYFLFFYFSDAAKGAHPCPIGINDLSKTSLAKKMGPCIEPNTSVTQWITICSYFCSSLSTVQMASLVLLASPNHLYQVSLEERDPINCSPLYIVTFPIYLFIYFCIKCFFLLW